MMNPSEHESVIKLLIANHLRNKKIFVMENYAKVAHSENVAIELQTCWHLVSNFNRVKSIIIFVNFYIV